jgi:hypothetical protein
VSQDRGEQDRKPGGFDQEFKIVEELPPWTRDLDLDELAEARERGLLPDEQRSGPTPLERWAAAQEGRII